jgi:hypothetical protein
MGTIVSTQCPALVLCDGSSIAARAPGVYFGAPAADYVAPN